MTQMIRVLIVDDHTLLRQGLVGLLSTTPNIQVVGQAADGDEAVRQTAILKPDVILMDLMMAPKDGLTAIQEIKQADAATRILVLTSFDGDEMVYQAMKAGAQGYMLKDSTADELIGAIADVYNGKLSLSPLLALKVIRELRVPSSLPPTTSPLTEREAEVLGLVAQGLSNQTIAQKLVISEQTVGKHVSNILSKLHLANRTQAALYAAKAGLGAAAVEE